MSEGGVSHRKRNGSIDFVVTTNVEGCQMHKLEESIREGPTQIIILEFTVGKLSGQGKRGGVRMLPRSGAKLLTHIKLNVTESNVQIRKAGEGANRGGNRAR